MNYLTTFEFDAQQVRILNEGGDLFFVAMDVAAILGYSDAHKMCVRLDEDEKQNRQIGGPGFRPETVITINESGLYSAILGSHKPEAKKFKKWITSEVLPTLRRTGTYSLLPVAPALPAPLGDADRLKYGDQLRRCYAQLDKAECFSTSVREGLRDEICDLLERLGRGREAERFRERFQVHPPFQRMFWETYAAIEEAGARVNHCAGTGGMVAVNVRQFQKQAAKFGYPSWPEAMYRKYLPFSEGWYYVGEEYLESRISRTSVSCLLFSPWS